jgi:hypothetical protein
MSVGTEKSVRCGSDFTGLDKVRPQIVIINAYIARPLLENEGRHVREDEVATVFRF